MSNHWDTPGNWPTSASIDAQIPPQYTVSEGTSYLDLINQLCYYCGLYDLMVDGTEQHDLAGVEPRRVQALAAKWEEWAARTNVLPLGGWRGCGLRRCRPG